MGAPGCPEFACCTASIARVRMVLMHSVSSCLPVAKVCSVATMKALPLEGTSSTDTDGSARLLNNLLRNAVFLSVLFAVYQVLRTAAAGTRRSRIRNCLQVG